MISCFLGCGRQFFLLDEEGDLEMSLRINGGRASLQQEVHFNYCYNCPQKIEQVQRDGPAENLWDGQRIIDIICWLCKWLNIPMLGPRNGLSELEGIISGNQVQEQFHYRFSILEGIQKYQVALV